MCKKMRCVRVFCSQVVCGCVWLCVVVRGCVWLCVWLCCGGCCVCVCVLLVLAPVCCLSLKKQRTPETNEHTQKIDYVTLMSITADHTGREATKLLHNRQTSNTVTSPYDKRFSCDKPGRCIFGTLRFCKWISDVVVLRFHTMENHHIQGCFMLVSGKCVCGESQVACVWWVLCVWCFVLKTLPCVNSKRLRVCRQNVHVFSTRGRFHGTRRRFEFTHGVK